MRVLIDTLGAPPRSGGMRAYAEELIHGWIDEFPEDRLLIVGEAWAGKLKGIANIQVAEVRGGSAASRAFGQLVRVPVLFHFFSADIMLSVNPIASPAIPSRRRGVVIHDWRHVRRSAEFSVVKRFYRRLWLFSISSAGVVIAISNKTRSETEEHAPGASLKVVENGRDHPRRWQLEGTLYHPQGIDRKIVTFGHLNNKRPELAIEAIARLKMEQGTLLQPIRLVVLGAEGQYRDFLRVLARDLGVGEMCIFPGYVSEPVLHELVSSADALMVLSTDEGFGLPAVEGSYFGVPVIVTSDSGLAGIHTGLYVAEPDSGSVAMALKCALTEPDEVRLRRQTEARLAPGWRYAAKAIRDEYLDPALLRSSQDDTAQDKRHV